MVVRTGVATQFLVIVLWSRKPDLGCFTQRIDFVDCIMAVEMVKLSFSALNILLSCSENIPKKPVTRDNFIYFFDLAAWLI